MQDIAPLSKVPNYCDYNKDVENPNTNMGEVKTNQVPNLSSNF